MPDRKVYCEVLEAATFESRCLYALSKVIEGNPVCENCILRELKTIKRCGIRSTEGKPTEGTRSPLKKRRKREWAKRKIVKQASSIHHDINVTKVSNDVKVSNDTCDIRSLSEVLGKSVRRTQELAKEGKVPGHKVGPHWVFDKGEIDRWLLKGKGRDSQTARPPEDREPIVSPVQGHEDIQETAGDPRENINGQDLKGS